MKCAIIFTKRVIIKGTYRKVAVKKVVRKTLAKNPYRKIHQITYNQLSNQTMENTRISDDLAFKDWLQSQLSLKAYETLLSTKSISLRMWNKILNNPALAEMKHIIVIANALSIPTSDLLSRWRGLGVDVLSLAEYRTLELCISCPFTQP